MQGHFWHLFLIQFSQSCVAKCLLNDWRHSWCTYDVFVGVCMTSLPVFRQTFGYSTLNFTFYTLSWIMTSEYILDYTLAIQYTSIPKENTCQYQPKVVNCPHLWTSLNSLRVTGLQSYLQPPISLSYTIPSAQLTMGLILTRVLFWNTKINFILYKRPWKASPFPLKLTQ